MSAQEMRQGDARFSSLDQARLRDWVEKALA